MNEAEARTSEELGNEQPTGTQDATTSEQTDTTSVSEPIAGVDITEINRDELSPEMQTAYDKMQEMYNGYNKDYTQKMQGISQDRKDAENWRAIQQVPEIAMTVSDMISQARRGEPVGAPISQPPAEQVPEIDPTVDPVGYLEAQNRQVIREEFGPRLDAIERAVKTVVGSVTQNQAQLEFENLKTEFPALDVIGLDQVNIVRSRHRDSTGQPISIRAALGIMAVDNPAILTRANVSLQSRKPASAAVEPPKQTGSGRELTAASGTRGLIDQVKEAESKGFNLDNLQATFGRVIASAKDKLGG